MAQGARFNPRPEFGSGKGERRRRSVDVSWVNWLTGEKASSQDAAFFLGCSPITHSFHPGEREVRQHIKHLGRLSRRLDDFEFHLRQRGLDGLHLPRKILSQVSATTEK